MRTDHKFITLYEKLGVKFISSSEDYGETRSQEAFSDKIFPQNINRFEETTNIYSDSLIRKILPNHSLKNIEIICLQKQNLKCESMKAEQIISTALFVIFRDNLIPIV